MAMCEDYPCCGHTDGLGCDWVSPNETQLCMECADARVDRPYHTKWEGDCPTAAKRQETEGIESAKSDYAIDDTDKVCDSCDSPAGYHYKKWFLCGSCLEGEIRDSMYEAREWRREYDYMDADF